MKAQENQSPTRANARDAHADGVETPRAGSERNASAGGSDATLAEAVAGVIALMVRLRDPERGCPWDQQQTFASIAPFTIEEAYEVAEAINRGDMPALKEELGDLLFQVVFHARLGEEAGQFDFAGIASALTAKMQERHPHVFGGAEMRDAQAQTEAWETQKAAKRAAKGASLLDDVPLALPALMRAEKLTKRATRIGFDWPDTDSVYDKLDEEIGELKEAQASGDKAAIQDEFGDVLFVMANLARKLGLDPEEALRQANAKFTRRFGHIEGALARAGKSGRQELEALEALWIEAKALEKKG
ncbi:MAG: nucleoside triphosphate pyrophosphohydrolase [Hyphomonadaceae bacterium]|nr:nucleoside triphosphate pyrophosphohydrolase [Hyphomonadaceae bacterium]